jgi:hypothetical protein
LFKITVEIYGVPNEATSLRKIELELQEGAYITDLIAALKHAIPTLDGRVTYPGLDVFNQYYAFNINGRFYTNEREIQIRPNDHIAMLSLATGG